METLIRKVLNLPPRKTPDLASEQTADPWSQAGKTVQSATRRREHSVWAPVETNRSSKVWHKILRGLVVAVLVLVLFSGLRSMFFPAQNAAPAQEIPASVYFPQAAAGGIAERYVSAYYTWDEAAADARAKALSLDLSGGPVSTGNFGWDGTGKQAVNATNVVAIKAKNDVEGTVTVRYTVTPYKSEQKKWIAQAPQVRAADVSVQIINGRTAVVGSPALVAVPDAGNAPSTGEQILDDPQVTEATAEYATTFFRAYGEGGDVSALTAPGTQIAGIGGVALERVSKWTVLTGTADTRQAVATVQWRINDATTLDQSYDVTLQRVTSGGTERWQVATIQGK